MYLNPEVRYNLVDGFGNILKKDYPYTKARWGFYYPANLMHLNIYLNPSTFVKLIVSKKNEVELYLKIGEQEFSKEIFNNDVPEPPEIPFIGEFKIFKIEHAHMDDLIKVVKKRKND
jgi:hypothetical protein